MRISTEQRFWQKVVRKDANECWNWIAATTQGGYGIFRISTTKRCSAARFAYASAYGSFSENLQILHLCHNTLCCNPAHLVAGTAQENCLHDSVVGKRQSNSTGPVVGVRWREARSVWESQGTVDGKAKVLYHGPSLERAVIARQSWESSIKENRLSFLNFNLEISNGQRQ